MVRLLCWPALILSVAATQAQEVRMAERLPVGASYHVSCRVQIAGTLKVPEKVLSLEGQSVIEYDERVLSVNTRGEVDRTLRLVSRMDFERKFGGEPQRSGIRPTVSRLVILRQNNLEVPFSPDGPLKWAEIDLVRTDVFTPALSALLPGNAVRVGESWKAGTEAIRELTDLEKITRGELGCRLDKIDRAGSPVAKVSFQGTIEGIGENGPTKHDLEGFYYFDLNAQRLGYVSLRGTEYLLDASGVPQGKVTGSFVLTREPKVAPREIGDGATGLDLMPNETNTQMLFDDDDSGLRFLHSRRWRARQEGNQVKLDDHRGNGLILTVEPPARLPAPAQFQNEARGWLEQRKGKIALTGPVQTLQRQPTLVEAFTMDADVPTEKGTRQVALYYAVIRDAKAGVTLAGTVMTPDRAAVQGEMQRLATGLRIGR